MTQNNQYRRESASYFFKVALADRRKDTLVRHLDVLRDAYDATRRDHPFRCDAFVVMPDHMYAMWTLPDGDTEVSVRWARLKAQFARNLPVHPRDADRCATPDANDIWDIRSLHHRIRDQADFDDHLARCWWNPVKHGLVRRPTDWPFSSVHRDVRMGLVSDERLAQGAPHEFARPVRRADDITHPASCVA